MANTKFLENFLKNCPGLVGEIARFIDQNLQTRQIPICLGNALSFVATLKSDRIHYGKLHPNLYTCVLAPSGVGKSMAQHVITDICNKAEITHLIMGRPASDSGMLTRLQHNPRQLLIWDEFGLALSEIASSQSSYRVAIISTMMDLFSSAGMRHIGKEYAEKARIDIQKPYLSICASSTPRKFYDTLTTDFIESGFLSRWLVFGSEREIEFKKPVCTEIPDSILNQICELEKGVERKGGGNLETVTSPENFSLQVSDLVLGTIERNVQNKIKHKDASESERVLWSRAFEHTLKIAMLFADNCGYCTEKHLAYAWDLVEYLILDLIDKINIDIQDTKNDKLTSRRMVKFLNLIPPGGIIPARDLTRKSMNNGFLRQEREQKIAELLENELWEKQIRTNEITNRENIFYLRPVQN